MAACEQFEQADDAQVIAVFSKATKCVAPICTLGVTGPSIPMQIGKGKVELRDGSSNKPISLPRLQTASGAVSNLLFVKANGDLALFSFSALTGKRRLIIEDGELKTEVDSFPALIPMDLCEEVCAGVEYHVGVRSLTVEGEDFYQMVLSPKNCCDDAVPTDDANVYLTLNTPE